MIEQLEVLIEIASRYRYSGNNFFVGREISEKKYALSCSFHGVDRNDKVIVLLDTTIMLGNSNGMSITPKGLYWKNSWLIPTLKNSYSWEELSFMYEKIEARENELVFEPGVEFYIPEHCYDPKNLLDLIRVFTEVYIKTKKRGDSKETPHSIADELKKLSELRDANILSDTEFQQQKEKLLALR
jgi:hypothetical protein